MGYPARSVTELDFALCFSQFMIFPAPILLRAGIAQKATSGFSRHYYPLFDSSQIQRRCFIGNFFRPRPKALTKVETPGVKRAYGERVLVYYAGQRIVFVATLKLATLFVFSFCAFIAAPSVGINTEYGYWAPIGSRFPTHPPPLGELKATNGSCVK